MQENEQIYFILLTKEGSLSYLSLLELLELSPSPLSSFLLPNFCKKYGVSKDTIRKVHVHTSGVRSKASAAY